MQSVYEAQRHMRQKRRAALQRGVVALLDIGTTKVSCFILHFDPTVRKSANSGLGAVANHGAFRIIGVATTRSRGVERGNITHLDEAERAIRTVVQRAQKMANMRVDHVMVATAGGRPQSYGIAGQTEVREGKVGDQDIGAVLANCDIPNFGEHRSAIHAMPVNFALDHQPALNDPRGHIGHLLSVDMHLVTVDQRQLSHIATVINRCDLELAGVVSAAYCSAISALVEDEQEIGAACIDIGGGSTSISMFLRKHLIFADSVPIGGDYITKDLSAGLQIPRDTAERIKTLHGGVIATAMDDRDFVEIESETGDWHHDRRQFSRSEIIGIIRPRVEEILEKVALKLEAARFDALPSQRIVLTGGSSQIPGLDGIASRILGQQVRMGRPLRVHGLPQMATGPDFAASVGLSLYAAHPQDECWDFELPSRKLAAQPVKRAMQWVKDNW